VSDSPDDPEKGSGETSDDLPQAADAIEPTDAVDEVTPEASEPLVDVETADEIQVDETTVVVTEEATDGAVEAPADAEPVHPAEAAPPKVISIWPIWAWTMVGVVLVVIGLGVGAGVLSKTLLLDVISFWPAFVVIALIFAALIPRLRKGAPRLSAVLPLLLLTYLGVTVALHVARWDELPSTAADVSGPLVEAVTDARIELDLPGELVVRPANQAELYRVLMLNRGGSTGAPTALEIVNDTDPSISVSPRGDSGWFQSVGWTVNLSLSVTWEVEANAELIDIDLASVSTGDLRAAGDGVVILGFVRPGSTIELDGRIDLVVREGDRIDVVGSADVPSDWTTTGVGRSTAGPADPYTIIVGDGAIVTITER
jgi:hypothetical protein